jgi:hypothetical protein
MGITAGELMAQLEADPEWVAQKAARDADREAEEKRYREEEKGLVADLNAVGVHVSGTGELIKRSEPYPLAVPVLLRHLRLSYSDNIRDMIARCLAIPDAAPIHDQLVAELYKEVQSQPSEKKIRGVVQGLACAVAASTIEENIPSLITLLRDESLGSERILFLGRLKKSKRPEASQILHELKEHPIFSREIASWRQKSKKKSGTKEKAK